MMFSSMIAISVMILTLSGCIIYVEGANHAPLQYKQVQKRLDTQDIHSLIANVGAGQLDIKGVKGLKEITVTADIYYNENNDYVLTLKHRGEKAELIAKFEKQTNAQPKPYIDLSILVPAAMALTLNDGSGDMDIQNITGNIEIDDGLGDINVHTSQGKVTLSDGSGDINIDSTKGLTILSSGSGEVNVNNIDGPIHM